jgi:hypothetical protein
MRSRFVNAPGQNRFVQRRSDVSLPKCTTHVFEKLTCFPDRRKDSSKYIRLSRMLPSPRLRRHLIYYMRRRHFLWCWLVLSPAPMSFLRICRPSCAHRYRPGSLLGWLIIRIASVGSIILIRIHKRSSLRISPSSPEKESKPS